MKNLSDVHYIVLIRKAKKEENKTAMDYSGI